MKSTYFGSSLQNKEKEKKKCGQLTLVSWILGSIIRFSTISPEGHSLEGEACDGLNDDCIHLGRVCCGERTEEKRVSRDWIQHWLEKRWPIVFMVEAPCVHLFWIVFTLKRRAHSFQWRASPLFPKGVVIAGKKKRIWDWFLQCKRTW